MRTLKTLLLGVGAAAIWPAYLLLMAYAARQAPWPRSFAIAMASVLALLAVAALAAGLARESLGPNSWVVTSLGMPTSVTRQLKRGLRAVILASIALLIPEMLLSQGLIAPGGRPISAPATCQFLVLGFELTVWGIALWLLRRGSPLCDWLADRDGRLGRIAAHRRTITLSALSAIALVIVLDARGYSFSARRMAMGGFQTLMLAALGFTLYRLLLQAIDHHAWRWMRPDTGGDIIADLEAPGSAPESSDKPDDLASRLRRLAAYLVPLVCAFIAAWIWDVDLALYRTLSSQDLWLVDATAKTPVHVNVGDLTRGIIFFLLTIAAWRHLSTFFALVVFPRLPDDPGMRFAVLTLCRYAVLGLGLMAALASIHLGPDKISMVLAALGVGLGFGLQEIVSNFVCGIILLLERPIRVGDIVSVSGMTRHGRSDQHPSDHDHEWRESKHHRPESSVHHGRPGQLDAQGQDHPGNDPGEGRPRDRPGPRLRPAPGGRPR